MNSLKTRYLQKSLKKIAHKPILSIFIGSLTAILRAGNKSDQMFFDFPIFTV